MSEIPEGLVHRGTIIAGPGERYQAAMPQWAKAARVILKGGDAAKPDGSAGEGGYAIVELYGEAEETA